ncbi:unnamed protein product, partial [Prorocentrum cordatum]
ELGRFMEQAPQALLNDIAQFLEERKLGRQFMQGVVKHHDVACLLLFCSGESDPGPRARAMKVRVVSEAARLSADFDSAGQLELRVAAGCCDIRLVPGVMRSINGQGPSWEQMERVLADVVGGGPHGRKRRPPGALFARGAEAEARQSRRVRVADPLPPVPLPDAGGQASAGGGDGASASHAVAMAAAPLCADISKYDQYDKVECQSMLVIRDQQIEQKDAEIERLRNTLASMTTSRDHYAARAAQIGAQLVEQEGQSRALHDLVCWRPRRNVTPFGGYNLALRRNRGHAGAGAAALMIACDSVRGHITDYKTVVTYEYRAHIVKRLRSFEFHRETASCCLQVHLIQSDGTNHEAVQREKVHTSLITTVVAVDGAEDAVADLADSDALVPVLESPPARPAWARRHCVVGDLQAVTEGSGMANRLLHIKELRSVGCPAWTDPPPWRPVAPGDGARARAFIFGVDAGSENTHMLKAVKRDLATQPLIMVMGIFCYMHQVHIAVKGALELLDAWDWQAPHTLEGKSRYVGRVATISNVWRATGGMKKIMAAAESECDDGVARAYFSKMPGRVLKGRWGSIDSVEKMLTKASPYLPNVFRKAFPDGGRAAPAHGPAADEADQYAEDQKNHRQNARTSCCQPLFLAMMHISLVAKGPLAHFLNWAQKRVADTNGMHQKSMAVRGQPYMGPTPLSELVTEQCASTHRELSNLLTPLAGGHGEANGVWGRALELVPDDERPQAFLLMVSLVLQEHAQWAERIVARVGSFPLQLLVALKSPLAVDDPARREMAGRLLAAHACCVEDGFSDVAVKTREIFKEEFRIMRDTGTCPASLAQWIALLRSNATVTTQEIEGMNSVIQAIGKAAPFIHLPLVAARIGLKKGDALSAEECVARHAEARLFQGAEENNNRFANALPVADVAAPGPYAGCPHRATEHALQAARFAKSLQDYHATCDDRAWVSRAYSLAPPAADGDAAERPAFVISWTYCGAAFVALGQVNAAGDLLELNLPLASRRLILHIADAFADRIFPAQLRVWCWGLQWISPSAAILSEGWRQRNRQLHGPPEIDALAEALGLLLPDEDVLAPGQDGPIDAEHPEHSRLDENGADLDDERGEEPVPDAEPADPAACPFLDLDVAELKARHAVQVASVEDALRSVAARQPMPAERGSVGLLITKEEEVLYVQWTQVNLMKARPISFNYLEGGAINFKATPAFAVPEQTYDEATIIMRDTGLRFTRGKKDVQPALEGWQLLAYKLHQAKLFGGPLAEDPHVKCEVCQCAVDIGADRYVASLVGCDFSCYRCQVCCKDWHACCAEKFGGVIASPFTCPLC